jgi:hypothetical protein
MILVKTGQSHLIFGTGSTGSVTTSLLSKLCCAIALYKLLENLDAIALLVKKTPLGEIRRNKRLVIFIDDLQDYVLSPRRDSDSKALIGNSCTTTLYQVPDNTTHIPQCD